MTNRSRGLRVTDLIKFLQKEPPNSRVVTAYDGGLYPILCVKADVVGQYPHYGLLTGEPVTRIVYAEYY